MYCRYRVVGLCCVTDILELDFVVYWQYHWYSVVWLWDTIGIPEFMFNHLHNRFRPCFSIKQWNLIPCFPWHNRVRPCVVTDTTEFDSVFIKWGKSLRIVRRIQEVKHLMRLSLYVGCKSAVGGGRGENSALPGWAGSAFAWPSWLWRRHLVVPLPRPARSSGWERWDAAPGQTALLALLKVVL